MDGSMDVRALLSEAGGGGMDVLRAARDGGDEREAGFGAALAAAGEGEEADEAAAARERAEENELRHAAEQLVASAFIKPLLAQMREDPLRTELFHGGTGEDLFGAQLDTHMADEMVGGMNLPLVDAIERFLGGGGSSARGAGVGERVSLEG